MVSNKIKAKSCLCQVFNFKLDSFFGYAGSGSGQSGYGQIQNIESLKRLYSVCWGGNKWPRRPLGGELQCGGLRPLCEGLLGGSSVEEGVGQPAGVP